MNEKVENGEDWQEFCAKNLSSLALIFFKPNTSGSSRDQNLWRFLCTASVSYLPKSLLARDDKKKIADIKIDIFLITHSAVRKGIVWITASKGISIKWIWGGF